MKACEEYLFVQFIANSITPRDLKRISDAVYEHCGINLHEGKQELVQARLTKLLRHTNFQTLRAYLDYVLARPESREFSDLIDALSTNLTSFFRESEHFDYLGRGFLPSLLERKRTSSEKMIRGWSAACSSGEEPYSIAMVVQESLEKLGQGITARILATDISHHILESARQGVYDKRRAASIPQPLRSRYVRSSSARHDCVEPTDEIRQMVRFAHLNLIDGWPFNGPFDFIFCRNVMIYFDKPTQQRLINRFWEILDTGGVLFTGHSESLTGIAHRFQYVQPTIYVKA